jgi:sterol desaturase/sphingolipid hydroxylase (fatty acid hydroxylase superfamily)
MIQHFASQRYPFLYSVAQVSAWLAILVVIFVPLERLFAAHPYRTLRKGILTDLGYYFLSSLLPILVLSAPLGLLAWSVHRVIPEGFLATMASLPLWARALLGLVAGELGYYWAHRWSHEIPFLWGFHCIHHSAEHVDFLVNSRAHPVDLVFGRLCALLPIYVLGLGGPLALEGSQVPVLVNLIGLTWGFFIHANLRWRFGPLEWLISTPAFHHWHHTRTGPINRNYSSTLPWLDWIFGTLYLPRKEWPAEYGIQAKVPESLAGQLAYPFVADRIPDESAAAEGTQPASAGDRGAGGAMPEEILSPPAPADDCLTGAMPPKDR